MIVDVFTFNGEFDMLNLHLNILAPYVDEFIIVEAPTTFSGLPKPLYYPIATLNEKRFGKFAHKIKYHVIDEDYTSEEIDLAQNSPNTQGAAHWKREFMQKERIKDALTHLKDDDIVFIGDVDEIWDPTRGYCYEPNKLFLKVYAYYLNNRSNEKFRGTLVAGYKYIKNECLNHLRSNTKLSALGGWHFTSMGGLDEVRRKLNSSYTTESYNTYEVQEKLPDRLKQGTDYLGRDFTFTVDESDWPRYLKDNREKYAHLLK